MDYTVLYETWQMQCCGDPFKIGDEIKWLVIKSPEELRVPEGVTADYCYEAHSEEWKKISVLTGKVAKIDILYEKFENGISVGDKIVKAESVDGYDGEIADYSETAFLVSLTDITLREAKRSEVTFE